MGHRLALAMITRIFDSTEPKLDAEVTPREEGQSKALSTVVSVAVMMVLSGSAVNFLAAIVYTLRADTTTGVAELSGDIWLSYMSVRLLGCVARLSRMPPAMSRRLTAPAEPKRGLARLAPRRFLGGGCA